MKIVLYTRRNVGVYCLSHLVALGHEVKVITDDANVSWLAGEYGCELVVFETMGEFDLFLSIHGNKIVPMKYLEGGAAVNIHPCLFKYKGHDPIKKYLENGDTVGSVGAHYMTEKVDEGELICEIAFETGKIDTYAEFYNIALPTYYEVVSEVLNRV